MQVPVPAFGTTIRIFLVDGTANGVWVVEKSNWTGKALKAPRTRYQELRQRPELDGSGVYVLVGPSDSEPETRAYVGQTGKLRDRLDEHNRKKDFWNQAVIFTSKDANLNKAYIGYLEVRLIGLAKDSNRAELDNPNTDMHLPSLSEPETAEAEAFLAEMLLIYPVLGVHAFERVDQESSDTLRLEGVDTKAEGAATADGFVVFANSFGRSKAVPSMPETGRRVRAALIAKGILVKEDERLRLTQDHQFSSPSTASSVMLGRSSNGLTDWKTSDGRTLKDVQTAVAD